MTTVWIDDLKPSPANGTLAAQAAQLDPQPATQDKPAVQALFGLGIILAVALVAWPITDLFGKTDSPPAAVDGLTIFAVFFVAALAIERLLEPFTLFDVEKQELQGKAKKENTEAVRTVRSFAEGDLSDEKKKATAEAQLQALANAKAAVVAWTRYKALVLWGLASMLGALAAALLNLHLLKTAGIKVPSLYLEILATGLILGAGTKPLHDLTKLLTAAKTSATTGSS